MLEDVNLKISQFVDGELDPNEALQLLKDMQKKPEMEETFRRYEAISHALKRNIYIAAEEDFVARVSAKISAEPSVLHPPSRPAYRYAKALLAVAASCVAVAVIVSETLQQRNGKAFSGDAAFASNQAVKQAHAASSRPPTSDARFNEYLEAHGATLYAGGYATPQAYGQVADYGRK